jgi:hypothetical protein
MTDPFQESGPAKKPSNKSLPLQNIQKCHGEKGGCWIMPNTSYLVEQTRFVWHRTLSENAPRSETYRIARSQMEESHTVSSNYDHKIKRCIMNKNNSAPSVNMAASRCAGMK